jgi:hypothetical protein
LSLHRLLLLVALFSFVIYSLYPNFIRNSYHCIFSVIPDNSSTREPVIDIVEFDADIDEPNVSPVEGLVELNVGLNRYNGLQIVIKV